MCVILHLKKGQMPTKDQIFNAAYNNWHAYGLVTRVGNKLDIKRKVPKNGEVDPNEVWKLLTDDVDEERFLHLRHNTAGKNDLSNCHPFDVFYDPKKEHQIVFMHNGTMYDFKSKKLGPAGNAVDDDDGPSDTKNYVDQILIPYVASMDFGNGKGDITNPLFVKFIKKFWGGSNRGLLISSKYGPLFIDDWKKIKGANGEEFSASNDDYFDALKRGPEYTRREAAKKRAEEEQKAKNRESRVGPFVKLSDYNFNKKPGFYGLSTSMANILNDWELYDRAHAAMALGNATRAELEDLYKDREACLSVMEWIFTDYGCLFEEESKLEEKKHAGEKLIAELKFKLAESQKAETKVG